MFIANCILIDWMRSTSTTATRRMMTLRCCLIYAKMIFLCHPRSKQSMSKSFSENSVRQDFREMTQGFTILSKNSQILLKKKTALH